MPNKIVFSKLGGPEVLEFINYDIKDNINDNDVRIQQTSIGLNFIDTYHRSGLYPLNIDFPICPGIEGAGEIIALGNKVNNFRIGERVCYANIPLGAYSEIRDFPADKLIKIPNYISNDEAASVLLKGMTVEYLFERLHKIKKDEYILFHAAAGGVGLIACQWARSVGCKMIGTVSTKEKEKLALENGCSYVINYKNENVVERINEITNGKGVKVVYDGVGKETFDISLECLSLRGLLVSFGQSSGMIQDINLHKTFNPKSLFYTRPTLMHYNNTREELEYSSSTLFKKIKNKEIIHNIKKKYNLEDAAKAHEDLHSRKTTGSMIFKC
ncbi:MAG: Quinone oxidoreductase 1 [Alphaproteobacteria bacterium MarineAlpha5_Bin7]|nr:MAG: Quinone oxidoreductase 1 [Alphaproteobacteria bacterium MarineAlpha5_Bin7]|tara:strand:- start:1494 stop:2477 length:984 start_codon:yes stop_codon:yes gene_type:complete